MRSKPCKVKICGTTSVTDAQMAADAGADYSGVVTEVSFSERSVSIPHAADIARQTPIPTVVLVFDRTTDWVQQAADGIQPFAIQLLGHESPAEVERLKRALSCEIWKSLFLPTGKNSDVDIKTVLAEMEAYIGAGADALLFDTVDFSEGKTRFGGTGKPSDWTLAETLIQASSVPAFLSGGIRPENVKTAIETVRPYGIDLCSGVESAKGVRNAQQLDRLMQQVNTVSLHATSCGQKE
ncbi:MAG: phosphoribosylanthranilate isomerase [Candidatus Poribacteria bacterium]|nr:phosphoribosylanthranilate isomerase [Candidatus Poribacteria bacterium]